MNLLYNPSLPLVSVVVTTYGSAKTLESCLSSVRGQTYPRIELVVVDTNSKDGTQEIAKKYTDKFFYGQGPERSAKRNFGARIATGDFVFIVDSDMELASLVVEQCVTVAAQDHRIKAVVVPEKSAGTGFWTRCKALERSFYVGVSWMEAARFFERAAFLKMGGYDEENTGSEDYDLPQRIKQKYGEGAVGRVSEYIVQYEGKISLAGSCRKKFYYSRSFARYARNAANVDTFRRQSSLLRRYLLFLSAPGRLLNAPLLGSGMLFMKTCEFVSGGLGYLWAVCSQAANKKSESGGLQK